MTDVPALKLRLAELVQARAEYAAQDKQHFVLYLDRIIAEIEAEIALAEVGQKPKPEPI